MISLTSEYALRALICIAENQKLRPIPGKTIATNADIPHKYLSKILGDLVRVGVLVSAPGIGGGFRLARPPQAIYLKEILAPFEPTLADRRPCPFGNEFCNDDDPCPGHFQWKTVRESYARFLEQTSISDVSLKCGAAPIEHCAEMSD